MYSSFYVDTFTSEKHGAYLIAHNKNEERKFYYKIFKSTNEEHLSLMAILDILRKLERENDYSVFYISNPYVLDLPNRLQTLKNNQFIDKVSGREWTKDYIETIYLYLTYAFPNVEFKKMNNNYTLLLKHLFKRKIYRIKKSKDNQLIDEREVHSVRGGFELDKVNRSKVPQELKGG